MGGHTAQEGVPPHAGWEGLDFLGTGQRESGDAHALGSWCHIAFLLWALVCSFVKGN